MSDSTSHTTSNHQAWIELEKACESGAIVVGRISGKFKGGFNVELRNSSGNPHPLQEIGSVTGIRMGEIRALLPDYLIDARAVRDTLHLEGEEMEFKVVKLDQKRNKVVVSHRAAVEQKYSEEREKLLENYEEGQEVVGVVKKLSSFGAFIDLGGIYGLLHITDMAWSRVKRPSEIVEIGDEIKVKVLKIDLDRKRISLGLKQLSDDPWVNIARRYPERARLFGKVTNITSFGCFVEIESGVQGLVHVSEMDRANKNIRPSEVVALGDEVEVLVLGIDEERHHITLSIKQCGAKP